MFLEVNNIKYEVVITRKNIKNMYLRVKDDLKIYISCSYLISNKMIIKFLEKNEKSIIKMINVASKKKGKKDRLFLLGKGYDVVICNSIKKIIIDDDKIFVRSKAYLDKYIFEYAKEIFKNRLDICYNKFEEKFDYPGLKVRRMKSKWGYCCKKDNFVGLSLNLIAYSEDEIDYVIIHELSHFVYFNHSKGFWNIVKKYKPDYKKNQKILKEE